MPSIQPVKGKKSTTYRVEVMIDGVRSSKTLKTKREAELYAARMTIDSEQLAGTNYRFGHTTLLEDLISEFLCNYKGKDSSMKQRLSFWVEALGDKAIAKVSKDNVRTVLKSLIDCGKSNATYNRYKAALSAVFKYAEDEYSTDHNPCKGIRNKPEAQAIDRWATKDELERLFSAAKKSAWPRLYLFVLIALHTGARRGNCLALRWSAIDFNKRLAYLATSKGKKPVMLPLNIEVIAELEKFREVGNGFIFPHPEKPNTMFRNFDYHWYKALEQAGIQEQLRIHDLRHTTASWLAQAGVATSEIQQIMAHKSITTTQRYIHHDTAGKAEKLKAVFGGLC